MTKPYSSLYLITINSNTLAVDDNSKEKLSLDESILFIESFFINLHKICCS